MSPVAWSQARGLPKKHSHPRFSSYPPMCAMALCADMVSVARLTAPLWSPCLAAGAEFMQRFVALLGGAGLNVDQHILDTIIASPHLRDGIPFCYDIASAVALYQRASQVPCTNTRIFVRQVEGVLIDGLMVVPGVQSAMFFHAFRRNKPDNFIPSVLKVPDDNDQARKECRLWTQLGEQAFAGDFSLVPVSFIQLGGRHSVMRGDSAPPDVLALAKRSGLLMPQYACTLASMPTPLDEAYGVRVFECISAALGFLHHHSWLHGDVKPSNIFIDAAGRPWLGDYGSSQPYADLLQYTGGTPCYQCEEALQALDHAPLWFDKMGLAISLLCHLDLLLAARGMNGWPLVAIEAACNRVESVSIQKLLLDVVAAASQ